MLDVKLNLKEDDYRSNEAYKSLRTNIEFSGVDNKVLGFTSCTPNEGKSSVSIMVAKSLTDIGKKVLFIDADLRKSVLIGRHRVGQVAKGLSHLLSGQAKFDDVACHTEYEGMDVIFAGPVPPNPAELVGGRRFEELIHYGREHYDYVIIDTPPLGSVIDSAIIAKACDAMILVISANTISYKFAKTVKAQLEQTGCKILGVALNKVDMKQNKYYGKYYGNYYGKEEK